MCLSSIKDMKKITLIMLTLILVVACAGEYTAAEQSPDGLGGATYLDPLPGSGGAEMDAVGGGANVVATGGAEGSGGSAPVTPLTPDCNQGVCPLYSSFSPEYGDCVSADNGEKFVMTYAGGSDLNCGPNNSQAAYCYNKYRVYTQYTPCQDIK